MNFKVLDLFAGAGGFSLGLEMNDNFKTVLAVDYDSNAMETFKHNFPKVKGIVGDITDKEIKNLIIKDAENMGVNVIVGGPPCQGFSLKGKKQGLHDPRNFLFLEFFEIIEKIKPEIVIIENVKNLIHSINGYFIKQIVEKLNNYGYIVNYDVLNAKNFGVPQNRERAIIIGTKNKSVSLDKFSSAPMRTVKDAISDLSYLYSGQGEVKSDYLYEPQSEYQLKLRKNSSLLYNHKATKHSPLALKKLNMIPPEGDKKSLPKEYHGKQRFSSTWGRLQWSSISPTIDTRFDTPSNGKNSHPNLNRAITPREAARIQSFPDDFFFSGPKTSVCKQIGNAVPPLLAYNIGKNILETYINKEISTKDYHLYNDDAFSKVDELIKRNIKCHHIITDPPYNISKDNNFSSMKNPRAGVNFGNWDKEFKLLDWIPKYSQLLCKNGSFIVFCSYKYISFIVNKMENSDLVVKDVLVWRKSNPMPRNIKRRYVQDMEFAIWAVKRNAKWVFNKRDDQPYMRSLFDSAVVSGNERVGHPTQKSLKVMMDIINIHTNYGEIILDPFMGSGTTGLAAVKTGRKFLGIEVDNEYFKIAEGRLKGSSKNLRKE